LSQAGSRAAAFRERWRGYELYLNALMIFSASRVVVVIGLNFGKLLVRTPDQSKLDAGDSWYDRLLHWDSGWFASIVNHGYRYDGTPSPHGSVGFYPLYPLFSYAVKSIFGIDTYIALLLVANAASLAVALLMTKFVKDELGDDVALLSLTFFCFFPSSIFLSAGYSESLCLAFILASFIVLTRQKFVFAALLAALSLGARSTGIVMIPVILWEMWQRETRPLLRALPKLALCAVLAGSGLLAYMLYLGTVFGDPLSFASVQAAWGHQPLAHQFIDSITLKPFRPFHWWTAGWFVCFFDLTILSFWFLRFPVALYALASLELPYLTLGITDSMNRFVLMCFPAFMCLAVLCKGRRWLTNVVVGILAALLLRQAALFSQGYWLG
jgi:Gpi18-like mannosyltransferase